MGLAWVDGPATDRHGVRALADLSEPVPDRCAVPLLHGGVGGHRHAAGRGLVDRAPRIAGRRGRAGAGGVSMAMVDRGAVVYCGVSADHGAVLGLLVDASLVRSQ